MLAFIVGAESPIDIPTGGARWLTSTSGYTLIMSVPGPSEEFIQAWDGSARIELRARATDTYVHICFRIGEMTWGDCMVTWLDIDPADIPERCADGEGTAILFVLVDAETERIAAMRFCAPSTSFSHYLHDGFERTRGVSKESYALQTKAAQEQHPNWHAARAKEMMVWQVKETAN